MFYRKSFMCTLTYIPTGSNTFLWTHSRDESPARTQPGLIRQAEKLSIYPNEPISGGTWIAVHQQQRVLSLLNGAFTKTAYKPSTSRSRGLILLDALYSPNMRTFLEEYDFKGIQPFTLVAYNKGNLFEFRWDESNKHCKTLSPSEAHIWSASTLYTQEVKAQRRAWFADYLSAHPKSTPESILAFHQLAGTGDPWNDLVMDRGVVKTVSITSIVKEPERLHIKYDDLIHKRQAAAWVPMLV